ncbi:MAG: isoprenylcysteine carboxylmethyltransferase family protein [Planctomycetota bacterium]
MDASQTHVGEQSLGWTAVTWRIVRGLAWGVVATCVIGVVLFVAGGTLDRSAWQVYCAVYGLLGFFFGLTADPGLIKERKRPGPGGIDRGFVPIIKLVAWTVPIVAAMDVGRFHWSDTVAPALQAAGLIGFAVPVSMVIWAIATNRFFSPVVRIQKERGHHLVRSGPYRFVRHPGYLGLIVGMLSSPPALGSWVSMIPAIVFVGVILHRTVTEDRFLQANLPGYSEYSASVRFRLLPGVW